MVDIGNTHTVLGLFRKGELIKSWRISSQATKTEDEIWIVISSFFKIDELEIEDVKGVGISSVVPEITLIFTKITEKYLKQHPIVITPDLKLDIRILYQDPYAVGADRICNAIAGIEEYGKPLIILDFGTATTFDCIDRNGNYLGGLICPGIESAASILHRKAAKLPKIDLEFPRYIIGNNTEHSMKSGIMYGTVVMIEGLIGKIKQEMDCDPKVIATGGLASLIAQKTNIIYKVDHNLNLKGIYKIYLKNKDIKRAWN